MVEANSVQLQVLQIAIWYNVYAIVTAERQRRQASEFAAPAWPSFASVAKEVMLLNSLASVYLLTGPYLIR
jgi:hypothetical protein